MVTWDVWIYDEVHTLDVNMPPWRTGDEPLTIDTPRGSRDRPADA